MLLTALSASVLVRYDAHHVYQQAHFVLDAKSDGQPVQLLQRLSDVVVSSKAEDQSCSGVLNVLETCDC